MPSARDPGTEPLPNPDSITFNEAVGVLNAPPQIEVTGETPVAALPRELLAVDAEVASDPDFDVGSLETATKQFRFWQVAQLLDQAADLLDRCLRDRAAYDQLRAQWWGHDLFRRMAEHLAGSIMARVSDVRPSIWNDRRAPSEPTS